jgi:hypothetical protein
MHFPAEVDVGRLGEESQGYAALRIHPRYPSTTAVPLALTISMPPPDPT